MDVSVFVMFVMAVVVFGGLVGRGRRGRKNVLVTNLGSAHPVAACTNAAVAIDLGLRAILELPFLQSASFSGEQEVRVQGIGKLVQI